MKYAVNILDLTKDMWLAQWLISPVIPSRITVKAESTLCGNAIILECDEKQAIGIIHIIRIKYAKYQLRCYLSKTGTGGWKRI